MRLATVILVFSVLAAVRVDSAEVAIVVNRSNPISEQALKELVAIFEQRQQFWKTGERIHLILQESARPEKQIILRKVYRKGDEELKKYWLMKVFKGEIAGVPTTLSSNEAVKRFVRQVPNAIGFVDATTVDETVKVLRIEGLLPGDPGYPLSDRLDDT